MAFFNHRPPGPEQKNESDDDNGDDDDGHGNGDEDGDNDDHLVDEDCSSSLARWAISRADWLYPDLWSSKFDDNDDQTGERYADADADH